MKKFIYLIMLISLSSFAQIGDPDLQENLTDDFKSQNSFSSAVLFLDLQKKENGLNLKEIKKVAMKYNGAILDTLYIDKNQYSLGKKTELIYNKLDEKLLDRFSNFICDNNNGCKEKINNLINQFPEDFESLSNGTISKTKNTILIENNINKLHTFSDSIKIDESRNIIEWKKSEKTFHPYDGNIIYQTQYKYIYDEKLNLTKREIIYSTKKVNTKKTITLRTDTFDLNQKIISKKYIYPSERNAIKKQNIEEIIYKYESQKKLISKISLKNKVEQNHYKIDYIDNVISIEYIDRLDKSKNKKYLYNQIE
ncbi:hypothetical protein [Flavobacterium succinicans]|uniref:hypothetical protein n=1 Tax=Flavobacterium succinicans TaxID=29536 RepID=UPI000AB2A9A2|nr:hypothetical protein [Flavobacterium succinicans]